MISSALFKIIRTYRNLELRAKRLEIIFLTYLRFSTLELIQKRFSFRTDVQFGVIINQQNEIGMVDKPLTSIIEWIFSVNFLGSSL